VGLRFPALLQIYLSAYGSDFTAHPPASTGSCLFFSPLSLFLLPTYYKGPGSFYARSDDYKSATLLHKAALGMAQQILRKKRTIRYSKILKKLI